jgi:hypothetical protein
MAKFYAQNRIEHGVADDDGMQKEVKVFEPGDEVTGLDKTVMKSLWDASVLRMEESGDDPQIAAAQHASLTGEGAKNERTQPEDVSDKPSAAASPTTPPASGKGASKPSS